LRRLIWSRVSRDSHAAQTLLLKHWRYSPSFVGPLSVVAISHGWGVLGKQKNGQPPTASEKGIPRMIEGGLNFGMVLWVFLHWGGGVT